MRVGRVIDNIWATRKEESLRGIKLMIVRMLDRADHEPGSVIVAADIIGAGIGERVLVTVGSSARMMGNLKEAPVDAIIVGIIDEDNKEVQGIEE